MSAAPPPPPTLATAALASLSLGLAPFVPEPHLLGKLRWVAGGAVGMAPIDWGDLALHGAPWAWLAFELGRWGVARIRHARSAGPGPAEVRG